MENSRLRDLRRKSLNVGDRTTSSPSLTLPAGVPREMSLGPVPLSVETCPARSKTRPIPIPDNSKCESHSARRGSLVSGLSFFLHHGDRHEGGFHGRQRTRSTSPGASAMDNYGVYGSAASAFLRQERKNKDRSKSKNATQVVDAVLGGSPPSAVRRGSFVHR